MYCKLFASLYQGTLRGKSDEILVFTNLLAHCGRDGTVDKHFRAISEETGLPLERVKSAIEVLESADPESRSPEEEGARIVRMDEHRVWGWRVVNYGKYRAIRSEDDRAEQNRLAQQRWRERKKGKPKSAASKPDKPKEREKDKGEGERLSVRLLVEKIQNAYPDRSFPTETAPFIISEIESGTDPELILSGTKEAAVLIAQNFPSGIQNKYAPKSRSFFRGKLWENPQIHFAPKGGKQEEAGKKSEDGWVITQ